MRALVLLSVVVKVSHGPEACRAGRHIGLAIETQSRHNIGIDKSIYYQKEGRKRYRLYMILYLTNIETILRKPPKRSLIHNAPS